MIKDTIVEIRKGLKDNYNWRKLIQVQKRKHKTSQQ